MTNLIALLILVMGIIPFLFQLFFFLIYYARYLDIRDKCEKDCYITISYNVDKAV